jgi:ubiquinone/menaquinone biosynthesis C-methylase UbiE
MERLSCTSTASYNATEAAIHMARYQLAVPYCKGKSVLDVACGEGYGAFALKQLGAASVDGVDNSPDALNRAQLLFSKPGIHFHLHEAERVDELFADRRFEVIVCIETIEHLKDPTRFLRALQNVASENATIIITCPNDHWYYQESQSNPFHVKKYSFEAFRDLTTSVLGNAASWAYGAPVVGFGAVADDLVAGRDHLAGQVTMMEFRAQAAAIVMPPRGFANVGPRNCSYFVGIWGGDAARVYTSAVVPISMDDYANLVSWESARVSPRRLNEVENERSALLTDKARLQQQRDEAQIAWKELEAGYRRQLAERDHEIVELQGAQAAQEDRLQELAKAGDRFRLQAFALSKEFDLVSTQIGKIRSDRDDHLAKLQTAHSELAHAQHEAANLKANLGETLATLGTSQQELEATRAELTASRKEVEVTRAELAAHAQELEVIRAEQARTQEENISLADELDQLRAVIASRQGLRYLTRATASAYGQRVALNVIVKPARLIKPYLPAATLAAAQKVARALHLSR